MVKDAKPQTELNQIWWDIEKQERKDFKFTPVLVIAKTLHSILKHDNKREESSEVSHVRKG